MSRQTILGWLIFLVPIAIGVLLITIIGNQETTIARLEAERDSPPQNYFGDTVHCFLVEWWITPEAKAVEKYPGYRAVRLEKEKSTGLRSVVLVWNGKQWPPDTLKHKPMKRRAE